jgi:hypothetical protein
MAPELLNGSSSRVSEKVSRTICHSEVEEVLNHFMPSQKKKKRGKAINYMVVLLPG